MELVTHHRKSQDFQTKDPGQFFQAVSNPLFAVGIVLAGPLFPTTQIRSSHTTIDEMERLNLIRRTNLRPIPSGHRNSPERKWLRHSARFDANLPGGWPHLHSPQKWLR
jgi:hypothetical protein